MDFGIEKSHNANAQTTRRKCKASKQGKGIRQSERNVTWDDIDSLCVAPSGTNKNTQPFYSILQRCADDQCARLSVGSSCVFFLF